MLQDIRQNVNGPAAKIVVGLIVVAFSLFGIESILLGGGSNGVAEVNGQEISPQELQQAVTSQKRRLIAMMGEQIDPAMLDDERLGAQALQGLIGRKLMMQASTDLGLTISEREIGVLIAGMEQFQVDGKFDPELYKALLSEAGYTPAYFKQSLREDMALNQLRSGLAGSEFATPLELALNARVGSEQRDVRYLTIPLQKFSADLPVSDAQVESYYRENESEFLSLESVDLEYIELKPDDFFQPVPDNLILEAYELEIADTQYQTENRVSHILFESGQEQQQRLSEAQARLAAGEAFSEVAGDVSDDIGSAASGGDLGYTSGDAFPDEMEEAIAALELNTVSQPVETDAGLHLIVVTERNAGEAPALEEVRDRLHGDIQASEARAVLLRTVETLKDLSFNADDLEGPASELSLSVARAEGVTRAQTEGLFANTALLTVAFSEDVLEAGHNSEVVELGDNRFVIMRVRTHQQPEVKALEVVREDIVARISEQAAREAVAAEARRALEELRAGSGIEQFAVSNAYEWQVELGAERNNTALPREVLRRAFELPASEGDANASEFVMTPAGDALVFELVRVTSGDYEALANAQQQMLQRQVGAEYSGLVDSEFQQGLRDDADISVL